MATRKDVANRAGVSETTVSRVLNDNGYVEARVRQRVMQAIQDLNYVPHKLARSLKTGKTQDIACITHSVTNPFYSEVVLGIEEEAYKRGYSFSLFNRDLNERDYYEALRRQAYDGLIVLSPVEWTRVADLQTHLNGLPVIAYWDWLDAPAIPYVSVDLEGAMASAVEHLISLKHERVLFLGHEAELPMQNPRLLGYQRALERAGIPLDRRLVQGIPRWEDSLTAGYEHVTRVLQERYSFTAIAAANDLLAIGAVRALHEQGFAVPDDISVTGFDDIEMASYIEPSLTTVQLPKRDIGRVLATQLIEQIEGEPEPLVHCLLDSHLVVRRSTAQRQTF
jgi:DNA-binding LacI/PurR family transcriptional regulator